MIIKKIGRASEYEAYILIDYLTIISNNPSVRLKIINNPRMLVPVHEPTLFNNIPNYASPVSVG